jgi:hypothetical protein
MFEILLNEKSIVIIFVKLHVLHGISFLTDRIYNVQVDVHAIQLK